MSKLVIAWLDGRPRRVLLVIGMFCLGLLGFGLYLQHMQGLEPCPLCVVQRYVLCLTALCVFCASATAKRNLQTLGAATSALLAFLGAGVAARQSWLQWYPPQIQSCGRDLYGMMETFPLSQVVPMVFRGSGDCTKVDWTFLGGSIANWSFLCFLAIGTVSLALAWRWMIHRQT